MAVFPAGEQIHYRLHILHLGTLPSPILSNLGGEQFLKQYPIISDKSMVKVWIYTWKGETNFKSFTGWRVAACAVAFIEPRAVPKVFTSHPL